MGPATGWPGSGWEVHWGEIAERDPVPAKTPEVLGWGQRVGIQLMTFFIQYISPVDGDRCPCYPTCSDYSRQAIAKHGLLVGGVMTFDRLLHEGDEVHRVPRVRVYGTDRYYDPLENNDFWWYKKSH